MSGDSACLEPDDRRSGGMRPGDLRAAAFGAAVLAAVVLIGLSWAKWVPYAAKIDGLRLTHTWDGSSILQTAGSAPSLHGALSFAGSYTAAIWKALVVSLLIAAAIDALLSRRWLVALLSRGSDWRRAGTGALFSLPSMMCTCCTAPITVTLRRSGAPIAAIVGHWLGNPVLNPAVLVFLFLVAPWQWGATRALVGVAVVLAAALIGARLSPAPHAGPPAEQIVESERAPRLAELPGRFAGSLWRISRVLVPEYFVVVLLVGGFSGWFSRFIEFSSNHSWALLPLVALVAVLAVVPTGGEIPILLALAALGATPMLLGILLIALPALSLPSMVMVGRALTARVTVAAAACVALGGIAAGAVLTTLS